MALTRTCVGFLLLAGIALASNAPAADDETPPKPAHQLELPFADRGPFVHDGWTGFSPTGEHFAAYYTVKGRAYVAIWDTVRGKLRDKIEVGNGWINTNYGPPAAFTATGTHLAYLVPGEVRFHPLAPDQKAHATPVPKRQWLREEPYSSLMLAEGKEVHQLMYSTTDRQFWRDRCEIGPALKVIRTDEVATRPVAYYSAVSADRTQLAWVPGHDLFNSAPPCVIQVQTFGGERTAKLTTAKERLWCVALAFSPDGKQLACGYDDGSLAVWDIAKEKETLTVPAPQPGRSVSAVAFSHDGNWVAYGSLDKKGQPNVRIVDLKTGKVRWAWAANESGVQHLCWNRKGTQLGVLGQHALTIYQVPTAGK